MNYALFDPQWKHVFAHNFDGNISEAPIDLRISFFKEFCCSEHYSPLFDICWGPQLSRIFDFSMNSYLPVYTKYALCCYSFLSLETEELPTWVDKVIFEDLEPFMKKEKEQAALDILPGDAWTEFEKDAFVRKYLCRFSIRDRQIRHCNLSDPEKHVWLNVENFNIALHILGMHGTMLGIF